MHIEDRGYQFGDGVYEVCEINAGALIDEPRHLARLKRSLTELQIAMPLAEGALPVVLREVMRRNRIRDGYVYLQVTRGVATARPLLSRRLRYGRALSSRYAPSIPTRVPLRRQRGLPS